MEGEENKRQGTSSKQSQMWGKIDNKTLESVDLLRITTYISHCFTPQL